MKKRCLFIAIISWMQVSYGQIITPYLIGSSGGSATLTSMIVDYSVGESCVSTLSYSAGYLTQGFQQPGTPLSSIPSWSENNMNILLFPNPANSSVTLQFGEMNDMSKQVSITDITGKYMLAPVTTTLDHFFIDLQTYPAGIYLATIVVDGKQSTTIRFNKINSTY